MMEWKAAETNFDAVGVLRVSSKGQENTMSLPTQRHEIETYCKANGLNLSDIISIQESAKESCDRVKYQAAVRDARKKQIKHIVFYMNDREARNLTDIEVNNKLIRQGKLVIHHAVDRRVFWQGSKSCDFLQRNIMAVMNTDYSDRLSEKINMGTETKARTGWYPGGMLPLGYMWRREQNADGREVTRGAAWIVPTTNQQKLALVRREFELRAQGYSLEAIRNRVIQEGLVLKEDSQGYTKSGLAVRLKSKFYWGRFDWKGVEYRGKHPLIIDENILAAVKKSFERGFTTKPTGRLFSLKGWLKCECGLSVTYDPKKKGEKMHHYYRCTNTHKAHKPNPSITEDNILQGLFPAAKAVSISTQLAQEIEAALDTAEKVAHDNVRKQIITLKEKIATLQKREDTLTMAYVEGKIEGENYTRLITTVRDELTVAIDDLEKATNAGTDHSYRTAWQYIFELCNKAESLYEWADREERIEFLKIVCSNPSLSGTTIRFDLNKPFSTINEIREKGLEWSLVDDLRTELLAFHIKKAA